MFTKLPKSDVLPKIFVKMTQTIQILLDIFNKSALRILLPERVCLRLQDRSWLDARGCLRKQKRSQVAKLKTLSI